MKLREIIRQEIENALSEARRGQSDPKRLKRMRQQVENWIRDIERLDLVIPKVYALEGFGEEAENIRDTIQQLKDDLDDLRYGIEMAEEPPY